jgi:hypothetical protein
MAIQAEDPLYNLRRDRKVPLRKQVTADERAWIHGVGAYAGTHEAFVAPTPPDSCTRCIWDGRTFNCANGQATQCPDLVRARAELNN